MSTGEESGSIRPERETSGRRREEDRAGESQQHRQQGRGSTTLHPGRAVAREQRRQLSGEDSRGEREAEVRR